MALFILASRTLNQLRLLFLGSYEHDICGAEPGDRVEVDEPIAQVETDKVYLFY